MTKAICNILKEKIKGFPFIDLLAGLALTVTEAQNAGGDDVETTFRTIANRFPVSDDTNQDPAIFGKEIDLTPNSGRKSIIYFEDFGISPGPDRGAARTYVASIRCVGWFNYEALQYDQKTTTGANIEAKIIDTLTAGNPINSGVFRRLSCSVVRIAPKDAALFGRYTYNELQRQYLRPPFDFFGIDLSIKFEIDSSCVL